MMKTVAIIMAGGSGERFWPLSRQAYPKQLLKLKDDQHMLSMAIRRIAPVVPPEDIYVVTVQPLVDAIQRETPELPEENVIAEPEARNTAACLTLASALIAEKYGDATVVVLTADHFIHDEEAFQADCRMAAQFVSETDGLMTFGVRPNRPETGYGYIETGMPASNKFPVFTVNSFREKPDLQTARRFLEDGDFSWNSGMFVWRNSIFLRELELHLPAMYSALPDLQKALREKSAALLADTYRRLEKISIDVGLMERTDRVYVIRASFDWDDIGTWASLFRVLERDGSGNAVYGNSLFLKSRGSLAYSVNGCGELSTSPEDNRLVIGYNLEDIIIVNTPDAVLVLPANDVQKVKDVVAYLRAHNKKDHL